MFAIPECAVKFLMKFYIGSLYNYIGSPFMRLYALQQKMESIKAV